MTRVVHVVPVGFTKETLLESLQYYPVSKVVLVLGNKPELDTEQKAREVAKEIKKDLGVTQSEEIYVDLEDISSAALQITGKITKEQKNGAEVKVNLSGSIRTIGIAAYLAALTTRSEAYIGIPSYQDGKVRGISSVVKVPLPPLKELSKEKTSILKTLDKELTLEELTAKLNPKIKRGNKKYLHAKSLLSYHIKDLKKDGFIETKKEGKTLKIKTTTMGGIYVEGCSGQK